MYTELDKPVEKFYQDAPYVEEYPFTDICFDKVTEMLYIDVALAGFVKDTISIKLIDSQLHISSDGMNIELEDGIEYVQKNIETKPFNRVIQLQENYAHGKVEATMENGMLTISIEPSEPYSETIEIK